MIEVEIIHQKDFTDFKCLNNNVYFTNGSRTFIKLHPSTLLDDGDDFNAVELESGCEYHFDDDEQVRQLDWVKIIAG